MLPTTDDDFLRKVKAALDERELTLANLCVDGAHLWEKDPDLREQNHQNALAALKAAEVLGARTVRIDAGGREETWDDGQFDFVVERYREYVKRAEDNGYRMGPENHWGPERVPANQRQLQEAVDSPAFGLLLHLGNWRGADAERGDQLAAQWAMHTHIPYAEAMGDLEARLAPLRDAGYQGYWGIEHHSARDEYAEVGVQVARVRQVLDRWRSDGVA
ncbi:MAG: sugar phosphate isomerase/epimerase [Clostridiales bacterium]|nr:sugar phosphate isomerase/epimerase [Clostridiales bacterium]